MTTEGEFNHWKVERIKPFGYKNYGRIPHLFGSRLGERDYSANAVQERIAQFGNETMDNML